MKLAASMVRNTVPANTASLPHNMGSRLGTTVREERIIPVLYSPVISSTPRTPTASCAKNVPVSEVEIAVAPGSKPVGLARGDGREHRAQTDHHHDGDQQGGRRSTAGSGIWSIRTTGPGPG